MNYEEPINKETNAEKNGPVSQKNLITLIIVIALAVCLCAAAIIAVVQTVRNDNPTEPSTENSEALAEEARNTIALTVGDHQINAVELNYYYTETLNQFLQEYYYYIYYYGMIDTAKPLNEQYFDKDKGITWADYFLDMAKDNIKSTYMLCDMAEAKGFTLPESEKAYMDTLRDSIEAYAVQYEYDTVDSYVADIFGYGADFESYMAYFERGLLADAYYSHYAESIEYTDAQIREFETGKEHEYNAYSFSTYFLDPAKFLTGGTEGSDGKVTYTDEQIAASIEAAREAAEALAGSKCENLEAFTDLILGMEVHAALDSINVKEQNDVFYTEIDAAFQEWIISKDRVFGEVAVIPSITTSGEGDEAVETITGYNIIWFAGVNDNTMMLKDVRHILVMFKDDNGKTYNDGVTKFTDAQKAAAKAEAEALLEQWKSGAATEDSFAALATEKTADGGSKATGGLYENIYPGQMVENFEAWCYDETRKHGDTGLVESVYGYHIMFFVSDSDLSFRDYMITYTMRTEDLNKWHTSLTENVQLTVLCLDFCPMDQTLGN